MVRAVIVQRVVPHYRVPIFARLYEELGWTVACADVGPSHGLNCARPEDHPWLKSFPFLRSPDSEYRAVVPLRRILEETGAEALVAEFSLRLSSTWQLVLGRQSIPFAFWSQGWNRERGFTSVVDRSIQALRLRLMRKADAQIVYNDEASRYLRANLNGETPIFVAQNTLAFDTMPDRLRDDSPRDPASPHVVSIGRLTKDKHVPRVVEAFLALRQTHPGARLTIVGDGPDRAAVAAAAGASEAVTLLGAVYDEQEVGKILRSASLVVVGGSVGLSVNHALGYGVPVMIFDDAVKNRHHPEHTYVVEGVTGFRVRNSGLEGLTDALARALSPPGPRAVLGKTLRDYVETELTLDRMLDGFRSLDEYFTQRIGKSALRA